MSRKNGQIAELVAPTGRYEPMRIAKAEEAMRPNVDAVSLSAVTLTSSTYSRRMSGVNKPSLGLNKRLTSQNLTALSE